MGKSAIILGASGLTGGILLKKILKDDRYDTIKLFSRSKIENLPSKVSQFTGNILKLETLKKDFIADEVFCCIGTTAKKTPNKALYKKIDFGIPKTAAKLSKENKIATYIVVSAIGAKASSSIFYNKIKGEMQNAVLSENIKNTHILQPSIIDGTRSETRIGEKIGLFFFRIFQPLLIGNLKKYRITRADDIAQAMLNLANSNSIEKIITSERISHIAKKIN